MNVRRVMLIGVIALLGSVLLAGSVYAGELPDGKKDRKGFFLGFGLGGGAIHLRGSGASQTKGAALFDVKIGGGITEDILLMYNGSSSYTSIDGVAISVYTFPVAVQWYVWDNLYIRPGVGMSLATASVNVAGVTVSADSKVSFGADLAAGYEFRFWKRFSLSPEFVYHYDHIRGDGASAHSHAFGAQASMIWYF